MVPLRRTLPSTTSRCCFCRRCPRRPSARTGRLPPRSTRLYEPVHIIFVARGGGTWARETKLDSTRPRATCVLEDCAREERALMACSECTQSTRGALGAFLQSLDMTSNRLAKSLYYPVTGSEERRASLRTLKIRVRKACRRREAAAHARLG